MHGARRHRQIRSAQLPPMPKTVSQTQRRMLGIHTEPQHRRDIIAAGSPGTCHQRGCVALSAVSACGQRNHRGRMRPGDPSISCGGVGWAVRLLAVLHEEHLQLLDVVDGELVEATRHAVAGLLVGAKADLHQARQALEPVPGGWRGIRRPPAHAGRAAERCASAGKLGGIVGRVTYLRRCRESIPRGLRQLERTFTYSSAW